MTDITISEDTGLQDILQVERSAFGDRGDEIADLVSALLTDPSANPLLSLVARLDGKPVGHILFTRADVEGHSISVSLLAPLAVVPEAQGRGIGGALIEEGCGRLREAGTGLVFVLGHEKYYPRHGFTPAGIHGRQAPYPIPPEHAGAWMVRELCTGLMGQIRGTVVCADAIDDPRHWRE